LLKVLASSESCIHNTKNIYIVFLYRFNHANWGEKNESRRILVKVLSRTFQEDAGKYIAVVGDKVVAVSRSAVQAYKEAKKKYPKEEIGIFYMPTEEETVTLL